MAKEDRMSRLCLLFVHPRAQNLIGLNRLGFSGDCFS